jgi:2-dehydro-3-deoxyphosphogluconate aldolase/(4S)-4-hydroxy-2-oxoglutarate aldolase
LNALRLICDDGVVAIIRSASSEEALSLGKRVIEAGLRAVEVSLVTPDALAVISELVRIAPPGVAIGVGTALTTKHVESAVGAGASFIVSPTTRQSVIEAAVALGVVSLPGAATPTEAVQAAEWGADLIKIFPASLWSPRVLSDMLAALPDLRTVPTGGVTPANAASWILAGAVAVGIGSAVTTAADPTASVAALKAAISAARASL